MADKLPAPQYNRPITKARPQDPRRFESHDVHSADAQQDPEYRKMVQDIEALQHRQGWLAGRGAFDKDDLLYLKRKQDEERLKEQEQRDSESAAFAAARARAAIQQQETTKTSLKHSLPQTSRQQYKTVIPLQPLLKVKSHAKDARLQQVYEQPAASPTAKRPRLEADTMPSTAATAHDGAAIDPSDVVGSHKQSPAPQHAVGTATAAAQQVHHTVSNATQDAAAAAVPPIEIAQQESSGLAGFLGCYGSDDHPDSDSNSSGSLADHLDGKAVEPSSNVVTLQLPPAAELLQHELPDGGFAAAHQQQQQALAPTTKGSGHVSSDKGSDYHQHGSWI